MNSNTDSNGQHRVVFPPPGYLQAANFLGTARIRLELALDAMTPHPDLLHQAAKVRDLIMAVDLLRDQLTAPKVEKVA